MVNPELSLERASAAFIASLPGYVEKISNPHEQDMARRMLERLVPVQGLVVLEKGRRTARLQMPAAWDTEKSIGVAVSDPSARHLLPADLLTQPSGALEFIRRSVNCDTKAALRELSQIMVACDFERFDWPITHYRSLLSGRSVQGNAVHIDSRPIVLVAETAVRVGSITPQHIGRISCSVMGAIDSPVRRKNSTLAMVYA